METMLHMPIGWQNQEVRQEDVPSVAAQKHWRTWY